MAKSIKDTCTRFPNYSIWISGDPTITDIDWVTNTIKDHQYVKDINTCFLSLEGELGLIQTVNFPTGNSNTLDLFFTNIPTLVTRIEPIPGLSDHEIVFVDTDITVHRQKPVKRKIYKWKKVDSEALNQKTADMVDNFTTTL